MAVALDLIGGAVFTLLYDGVKQALGKTATFTYLLRDLKLTLESLRRLRTTAIQQIGEYNLELGLPNDEIEELKNQMEEGAQLVRKLSNFHLWNYCCINAYTDQLVDLDRSLRRLLENLKLEEERDVKKLLLYAKRIIDNQDDLRGLLQKILQKVGDVTEASTSESSADAVTEPNEGNAVEQGTSLGGASLAVFMMLFDVVIEVKDKTSMFRPLLEDLKFTLDSLKPLIEEMAEHNKLLYRPQDELEKFRAQLERGLVLIRKCSKIRPRVWPSYKKYKYTNKLLELDEVLRRQLNILRDQVASRVREAMVSVRKLELVIKDIEESGVASSSPTVGLEVSEPPFSPTVGLDVMNEDSKMDMIEETLVSERKIEAGIKEIEGSDVPDQPSLPTVELNLLKLQAARGVNEISVLTQKDKEEEHDKTLEDRLEAYLANMLSETYDRGNRLCELHQELLSSDLASKSPGIETPSSLMSWTDMAQEDNLEEAEELNKRSVNVKATTGELKIMKSTFPREQSEHIRFMGVKRKKNFICLERVKGKYVNILEGLELHKDIFSEAEQKRIVDYVFLLEQKGRNGELKESTFTAPRKWMRGKGRVTVQFGCCYKYAVDKHGNPPGIVRDEIVDPLPNLFKLMIRRLVKWHVLPPTCVPDSCIVNIYGEGDCTPPLIDHHDFVRPFCTVSFLSECNMLFGMNLKAVGPGEFEGPIAIPLPVGSVLVLTGNAADVAKHCVPSVPHKWISITFRRMDESKRPMGYAPEPDLQGIQPLSCDSFRCEQDETLKLIAPEGKHSTTRRSTEEYYSVLTQRDQMKEESPHFGSTSVCGRRTVQEDAVSIHPFLCQNTSPGSNGCHFYGVYDGHGCSHVALRCKERLHEIVKEDLQKQQGVSVQWKDTMERSFARMDQEVLAGNKAAQTPTCGCGHTQLDSVGSTAVVAVVTLEKIIVSNCGDSRAVLCRNGVAVPLSSDHKADRPDELARIEAAGGRVIWWDGARVFGVLQMSRAIGDSYLKPYVISEPEVTIMDRTTEDECLILASDGLWDVVSNDTACGVVRMCLRGGGDVAEGDSWAAEKSDKACSDASILLTKLALARHSSDNVSVVVVDLKQRERVAGRYASGSVSWPEPVAEELDIEDSDTEVLNIEQQTTDMTTSVSAPQEPAPTPMVPVIRFGGCRLTHPDTIRPKIPQILLRELFQLGLISID